VSAPDAHAAPTGEPAPGGATGEPAPGGGMSEEQLRAAYEEELRRMTSVDLMLQAAVSLINLAGRKLGPPPGSAAEGSPAGAELRDLEQVRDAIDGVRGLMGVLERRLPNELGPLRDALSQLQLAYAREAHADTGARGGGAGPGAERGRGPSPAVDQPSGEGDQPSGASDQPPGAGDSEGQRGPGPAESSGRLWVPGR
jgi:hypothetical protein